MSKTELANRFTEAFNNADEDAFRALFAENATLWHSHDNLDQTVDENWEAQVQMRIAFEASFEVKSLEELTDGYLQQYVVRFTNRQNGKSVDVYACIIATVENGLITRMQEYLDTGAIAGLME